MTVKVELAKGELQGGLKDSTQVYRINWLPRVFQDGKVVYLEKIEFALITPTSDGESSYHSLRFLDPEQVRLFIFDLVKAYAYFKKERGELNEFTTLSLPSMLGRKCLQIFKDTYTGGYT